MKIICPLLLLVTGGVSNIANAADFDATIEFPPRQELSLPVSGVIKTLNVTGGQQVSAGDVLLVLDPVPFNAARSYAQSLVTVRQTLLTESQRDLQQQQELYDRTVLARVDLENAELRVKRDTAILQHAQAQLAEADYALKYSRLIAPFDALVLAVQVNQGQSINNALQSKTLISLVRQDHYQATFYVSAEVLEKLQIGQAVTVSSAGKQYPGKISTITYQSLTKEAGRDKQFMITAGFILHDRRLPVGRSASVNF
jgi:multidrug efflux system membrane fusion protein